MPYRDDSHYPGYIAHQTGVEHNAVPQPSEAFVQQELDKLVAWMGAPARPAEEEQANLRPGHTEMCEGCHGTCEFAQNPDEV
ncbi:hypothetical protein ACFVXG_11580 [Kitasatospora sp. NPDC058162]|uniref:hypothetical protein n=1 Tax=Kitasatospora sp. NPDC058162 TaxID=3346362 RepID=UPI0036D96EAA